jgi:hypothetical protein
LLDQEIEHETQSPFPFGFLDPAKAEGSEEEVLTLFRQVRDDIGQRLGELLVAQSNL